MSRTRNSLLQHYWKPPNELVYFIAAACGKPTWKSSNTARHEFAPAVVCADRPVRIVATRMRKERNAWSGNDLREYNQLCTSVYGMKIYLIVTSSL